MLPEVRFSNLKRMAQSPAHYRASLSASYDTPAMRMGRLVHALVLGGRFVVYEGERRGKAWAEFRAQNQSVDIATESEIHSAHLIADAVKADPCAAPYLEGLHEHRMTWSIAGRACRGTPDIIGKDFIADLKTTNDASPWRFSRAALRMAYHAQLAWYQRGAAANGWHCPTGVLIAVETSAPYAVTVHRLTPRALLEGNKLCVSWFEQLRNCEESGHWPGYSQAVLDLDVAEDDEGLIIDGEVIAA
jgi:exodeoxyribonuclease VIII